MSSFTNKSSILDMIKNNKKYAKNNQKTIKNPISIYTNDSQNFFEYQKPNEISSIYKEVGNKFQINKKNLKISNQTGYTIGNIMNIMNISNSVFSNPLNMTNNPRRLINQSEILKNIKKDTKIIVTQKDIKNYQLYKNNHNGQNLLKNHHLKKQSLVPSVINYNQKAQSKLRKIQENENVVLPPIKNSHDNPTLMESKKYFNTEYGQKSGKDNDSSNKLKSVDEDESGNKSFIGSGKGSGTNSVDK